MLNVYNMKYMQIALLYQLKLSIYCFTDMLFIDKFFLTYLRPLSVAMTEYLGIYKDKTFAKTRHLL